MAPERRSMLVVKLRQQAERIARRVNGGIGPRPHTRAECAGGVRPCPWVRCRHNLLVDVSERGAIRLQIGRKQVKLRTLRRQRGSTLFENWAERAVTRLTVIQESCALDVAERGRRLSYDEVGAALGMTREGARQLCAQALERVRERLEGPGGLR